MTKLEELITKLSELFELDKADLDFGIHRIIKSKHKQIREYLETRLPARVNGELGKLAAEESASQIDALRAQVTGTFGDDALGADGQIKEAYANTPLGQKYEVVRGSSGGDPMAKTENDVYSHLLEFFSRYYEDADYLSLRRRTAGRESYSIPYNGEEVVLHWANKDQYYIKSSEDLKDYTFTVDDSRVKFKLTRMDAVQNNNKASRIFQLDSEAKIEATDDTLVIPFHFAEGKKRAKAAEAEWEQSILDVLPKMWQKRLAAADTSYTGDGNRNVLQKHLRNYTRKNTSDYFIHKDLGGFLRRELDFYVKNEVMYLDDVENRPANYLESEIRKIKAIRAVAHELIDFLKQFEDFQKKLWLKKKFVLETNWCITLDRVPEELYPDIAANEAQREEWVKLFAIDEIEGDEDTPAYSVPLTMEFLKVNDKLVLDTAFMASQEKLALLNSIEDFESLTDGVLVRGDNYQSIRLLDSRFNKSITQIYIDPPYNTNSTPIIYKNGYKHSSWMALMNDRISSSMKMLNDKGVLTVAIDDTEVIGLSRMLESYSEDYRLSRITVVHNPKGSITKDFNRTHEYALFLVKRDVKNCIKRKLEENETPRKMRRWGENSLRTERRLSFYPIYVKDGQILRVGDVPENDFHPAGKNVVMKNGEIQIWPIDQNGVERRWNFGLDSIHENLHRVTILDVDDQKDLFLTHEQTVPKTVWQGGEFDAGNYGNTLLIDILGEKRFDFPKSIKLVEQCLELVGDEGREHFVMDYFAGSGTTGHAAINLNRKTELKRRYILVEMGEYFDSVTKPRIEKVIYSECWQQGKPTSRNTGVSHCFKYIRLESYEDALNNLTLEDQSPDLLGQPQELQDDYLLRYCLDIETNGSLLDCQRFTDPFNYKLKIYDRATGTAKSQNVDLPETFNYLLGLKVRTMEMKDGALVIEGENPAGETVLVIWRTIDEMNNKKLEKLVDKTLRINTADTEYAAIYINGDTTLNDPHKKILLTEQVFHDLMFDTEGV